MEQKNFLAAMGLILSFLLLWSVFVVPKFTPPPAPPAPATDKRMPEPTVESPAEKPASRGESAAWDPPKGRGNHP